MCTHGAVSPFRTWDRTVIARRSRRPRDRGVTRRARHARSRAVRCRADTPNGEPHASPAGRAPLEPTYGSPGAHPAGSGVRLRAQDPRAHIPQDPGSGYARRIRGRTSRRIRGQVTRAGSPGAHPAGSGSGCRSSRHTVPPAHIPQGPGRGSARRIRGHGAAASIRGCRRNPPGRYPRRPRSPHGPAAVSGGATTRRPLPPDDVPYPCFSRCPPNPKRMAERTRSAKSASPRELKRS